jgi:hypothetical protein
MRKDTNGMPMFVSEHDLNALETFRLTDYFNREKRT